MTPLFFRCSACLEPLKIREIPICRPCSDALSSSPRLCLVCASPACPPSEGSCLRPWLKRNRHPGAGPSAPPLFNSFGARYLMVGPAYPLLRRWKSSGGPVLDHSVLRADEASKEHWQRIRPDAIVPVPHRITRIRQLRSSPPEKIASWIGAHCEAPVLHLVYPLPREKSERGGLRTASMGLQERIGNPARFGAFEPPRNLRRILIVDDFMTTGGTLEAAARALAVACADFSVMELHGYCLGLRPALERDPLHRGRPRQDPL